MKERSISVVWSHFTRLPGPEMKARCSYCERVLSISGRSTGNLLRHLFSNHKNIPLPESYLKNKANKPPKIEVRHVNRRSDIWGHFTQLSGKEMKFKCNYCKKVLTGHSGNVNRHLRLKHKTVTLSENENNRLATTDKEGNSVVMEVPFNPFVQRERETSSSSPQKITFSYPAPSSFKLNNQKNSPFHDYNDSPPSPSSPLPASSLNPQCLSTLSIHSKPFPYEQLRDKTENKFDEIKKSVSKNKSKAIDGQLTKMICKVSKHCHPFSLVEHEYFRQFVEILCPGYKIPNTQSISRILIPTLSQTTKDKLKEKLSQATTICISCDGWTSNNETTFHAVTVHFFDEAMTRHSYLVECSEFNKEHSVASISHWLDEVLNKYNIKNKIVAAVTENGENIKSALNALSILHIPCFAHSLNLVVENAVNECIKGVFNKVDAIVQYLKVNSTAVANLLENSNNPRLKWKKDFPSKWNSTFDKFYGLLKNKKIVDFTFETLHTRYLLNLDVGEWEIIEHAAMLLELFDEVSKEVRAEDGVSLSKTCILSRILISRVEEFLHETREIMLPHEIKDLGNQLLQGLTERFGDRENSELISQTLFLDPRFKKLGFGKEEIYNLTYSALAEKLRMMNTNSVPSESTSQQTQPEPQVKSSSLWEEFDAVLEMTHNTEMDTTDKSVVELDKYIAEPIIHRTSDPLAWWKERRSLYPNLYEIARQRLCIPATSIPCEQVTKAEQILNDKSFNLDLSNMLQILFLNSYVE